MPPGVAQGKWGPRVLLAGHRACVGSGERAVGSGEWGEGSARGFIHAGGLHVAGLSVCRVHNYTLPPPGGGKARLGQKMLHLPFVDNHSLAQPRFDNYHRKARTPISDRREILTPCRFVSPQRSFSCHSQWRALCWAGRTTPASSHRPDRHTLTRSHLTQTSAPATLYQRWPSLFLPRLAPAVWPSARAVSSRDGQAAAGDGIWGQRAGAPSTSNSTSEPLPSTKPVVVSAGCLCCSRRCRRAPLGGRGARQVGHTAGEGWGGLVSWQAGWRTRTEGHEHRTANVWGGSDSASGASRHASLDASCLCC